MSFGATQLVDNECALALARSQEGQVGNTTMKLSEELDRLSRTRGLGLVDWSRPGNKTRIQDIRSFVRRLFWAFDRQGQPLSDSDSNGTPLMDAFLSEHPSPLKEQYDAFRRGARRVVLHESFSLFFMLVTIYALFGPDVAMIYGQSPVYNQDLAIFNTVVLFLFVLECSLTSWVLKGYFCSGRFWVDLFATASMVGDTWLANELVASDAAMAGRGTRLTRLVRVGRSTRVMRLARVARVAQVLRLVPKIQRVMEKSTQDLAMLLLHKRIWHVFLTLDDKGKGVLNDIELDFFDVAMLLEFGNGPSLRKKTEAWQLLTPLRSLAHSLAELPSWIRRTWRRSMSTGTKARPGSFWHVVEVLLHKPEGKVALQRCVDDIDCMKESCEAMERMISSLTLKVCLAVLFLLIIMPLLDQSPIDSSLERTLAGLQRLAMAPEGSPMWLASGFDHKTLCDHVARYAAWAERDLRHSLLFLALGNRTYWGPDAHNCACCGGIVDVSKILNMDMDVLDALAREQIMSAGYIFPSHELVSFYMPIDAAGSVALFDYHRVVRAEASQSLLYTIVVVMTMLCFVVYFAFDMKKLSNKHILHPLFDLIDDLCAMRCMEVVAENPQPDAPTPEKIFGRNKNGRMTKCVRKFFDPTTTAPEMVQLSTSVASLKGAMRSWAKYVPAILLHQLMEAGVEAQIGATRCDVGIMFCDVENFKELCEDLKPHGVLVLLEKVLGHIGTVLAEHGGTLLEFIGDEVLAVFGAPARLLNHTQMAVSAAVDIRDTCPVPQVRLQLGVNRATVLAGNLGSPTRMKYGVMGDGVNMTARLKSLNTRYGTHLLVNGDALVFENCNQLFVTRPIGNLVLKGRTTPTATFEVLGKRGLCKPELEAGAEAHTRAFRLFLQRRFQEAKRDFFEANQKLSHITESGELSPDGLGADGPSRHLCRLCESFIDNPPPSTWDGSEVLAKKAW